MCYGGWQRLASATWSSTRHRISYARLIREYADEIAPLLAVRGSV